MCGKHSKPYQLPVSLGGFEIFLASQYQGRIFFWPVIPFFRTTTDASFILSLSLSLGGEEIHICLWQAGLPYSSAAGLRPGLRLSTRTLGFFSNPSRKGRAANLRLLAHSTNSRLSSSLGPVSSLDPSLGCGSHLSLPFTPTGELSVTPLGSNDGDSSV